MPAGDPGGNFAATGGYGGNFPGAGGAINQSGSAGGNPTTMSGGVGDYGMKQNAVNAMKSGMYGKASPALKQAIQQVAAKYGLNPYTGAPKGMKSDKAAGISYSPPKKQKSIFSSVIQLNPPPPSPTFDPITGQPLPALGPLAGWPNWEPAFPNNYPDLSGETQDSWSGPGYLGQGIKDESQIGGNNIGAIGGIGGIGPGSYGWADGGLIQPGQVGWVGERGPELAQGTPQGTRIMPMPPGTGQAPIGIPAPNQPPSDLAALIAQHQAKMNAGPTTPTTPNPNLAAIIAQHQAAKAARQGNGMPRLPPNRPPLPVRTNPLQPIMNRQVNGSSGISLRPNMGMR